MGMGGERVGPGEARTAAVCQQIAAFAPLLTFRDSVRIREGKQQTCGIQVWRPARRPPLYQPLELALDLLSGALDTIKHAAVNGSARSVRSRPMQQVETEPHIRLANGSAA